MQVCRIAKSIVSLLATMKTQPNQQDPPPFLPHFSNIADCYFSFLLLSPIHCFSYLCLVLSYNSHTSCSSTPVDCLAVWLSVWLVASPASAKEKLRRLKCGNFHFFAIIKFIFKLPLAVEAERAERPRSRRRLTLHYFPYTTLHFSFSLQS